MSVMVLSGLLGAWVLFDQRLVACPPTLPNLGRDVLAGACVFLPAGLPGQSQEQRACGCNVVCTTQHRGPSLCQGVRGNGQRPQVNAQALVPHAGQHLHVLCLGLAAVMFTRLFVCGKPVGSPPYSQQPALQRASRSMHLDASPSATQPCLRRMCPHASAAHSQLHPGDMRPLSVSVCRVAATGS